MHYNASRYTLALSLIAISSCLAATIDPVTYSKRSGGLDAQPMVQLAHTGLKGILGVTRHTVDGEFDILGRHDDNAKDGSDGTEEDVNDDDGNRSSGEHRAAAKASTNSDFGVDLNNLKKKQHDGEAKKAVEQAVPATAAPDVSTDKKDVKTAGMDGEQEDDKPEKKKKGKSAKKQNNKKKGKKVAAASMAAANDKTSDRHDNMKKAAVA